MKKYKISSIKIESDKINVEIINVDNKEKQSITIFKNEFYYFEVKAIEVFIGINYPDNLFFETEKEDVKILKRKVYDEILNYIYKFNVRQYF